MESKVLLILLGTLLGALEVTLGILIGRWVLRRNERSLRRDLTPKEIQSIAVSLYERILNAEGHLGDGHAETPAANAAPTVPTVPTVPTADAVKAPAPPGPSSTAKKRASDTSLNEATLTSVCNELRVRLAQVAEAENESHKR